LTEALKYVDNLGEDSSRYRKYIELLQDQEQKVQLARTQIAQDVVDASDISIEAQAESVTKGAAAEHILSQKIPLPKDISSFAHMMDSGILNIQYLSPQLIEAYFRYQKSLHSSIRDISDSATKWNIKDMDELIYNKDSIVKLDFPHHYAMLDPTLKIDS